MRTCQKCGRTLPQNAYDSRRKPDGQSNGKFARCRDCRTQLAKECWGKPATEHFWRFVPTSTPNGNECHEWLGKRDKDGYGMLGYKTGPIRAHRLAWEVYYGEDPGDQWVLHHCDNPPCIRKEHLYLGGPPENSADRVARGRTGCLAGEAHPSAILTNEIVNELRVRCADGRPIKPVARDMGIRYLLAWKIVRGRAWKHLLPIKSEA